MSDHLDPSFKMRCALLVMAVVIAFAYALSLYGSALNPLNTRWLTGDLATNFLGATMLLQDPEWSWPLTFTSRLGYGMGDSVSYLDPIPVLAVALRPLANFLPQPLQYIGLYAWLSLSLQWYFGARLIQRASQANFLVAGLSGTLFMTAPALLFRLSGHIPVGSHWLILAALNVWLMAYRGENWSRITAGSCLCVFLSCAINPYIAFMTCGTVMTAILTGAIRERKIWPNPILLGFGIPALAITTAFTFGYIRFEGVSGGGYRHFSMNLNSVLNPKYPDYPEYQSFRASPFLPDLSFSSHGQYEGYNYLGFGLILLGLCAVFSLFRLQGLRSRLRASSIPLLALCLLLTLMATSTLITIGGHTLIDLDPMERLTPVLSVFRASGRLFWVPYYVLISGILSVIGYSWKSRTTAAVFFAAVVIQMFEANAFRQWVYSGINPPPHSLWLSSPEWKSLAVNKRHLVVLPAWQCNPQVSPDGQQGFITLGMLAVENQMTINSYSPARIGPKTLAYHCDELPTRVLREGMKADSLYVVTSDFARRYYFEHKKLAPCKTVDRLIACTPGIPATWQPEPAIVSASKILRFGGNVESAKYLLDGWYPIQPDFAWSKARAKLALTFDDRHAPQSRKMLLHLTAPVASVPVDVVIRTAGREWRYTVSTGRGQATAVAEIPVEPDETGNQVIELINSQTVKPAQYGVGTDTRLLGVGLSKIEFVQPRKCCTIQDAGVAK